MRRTASLALAAFALTAAAGPAFALTISETYYEDQANAACSNTDCTVKFPLSSAIAGKFLFVQHIACQGTGAALPETGEAFISDGDGVNLRRAQPLGMLGRFAGNYFSFRDRLQMKVSGGPPRVINIRLSKTGSALISISCSLTGEIADQ